LGGIGLIVDTEYTLAQIEVAKAQAEREKAVAGLFNALSALITGATAKVLEAMEIAKGKI
jgi:hypothetical protein